MLQNLFILGKMGISDISLPFFDILLLFFFALVSLDFVYCENDTVDKAFVCYYCIVMTLDVAEVISMNLSSWCGHYLISIRNLTIIGILTRVISIASSSMPSTRASIAWSFTLLLLVVLYPNLAHIIIVNYKYEIYEYARSTNETLCFIASFQTALVPGVTE